MMKKTGGILVLALMILSLAVVSLSLASAATSVTVQPNNAVIAQGEEIVISITIDTTEQVYALSFDLFFDKNILEGKNSVEGGFLSKDGQTVLVAVNNINNGVGKFSFAATRSGQVGGVTGTGAIANITFNGSAIRQSTLNIDNVQIADPNLQPIMASVVDGTLTVNSLPSASNLLLSPSLPKTTDNLQADYDYFDPDGDPESGTEIRWYKNNVLQAAYNNLLTIPDSATSKGEQWKFTVKPKDGTSFGELKTSNIVTIQNSAPVLEAIRDKEVNEGQLLQFSVSATDDDGDALTYTADNLPSGATFNPLPTFSWTPGFNQAGIYEVTFNVTDGTNMDFETITITVNDVNRAPTIDTFSPLDTTLKTREGYQLSFNHTSSDPDDGPLNYIWDLDTVQQSTSASWIFSTSQGVCGQFIVNLEVSDSLLLDTQSWTVNIYLKGDVDKNNIVNIFDLAAIGLAYRSQLGDSNWNSNADIHPGPQSDGTLEGNGEINIFDLATVGLNYNRVC